MNPVEKNHHCVLGQYKRTYTVAYNLGITDNEVSVIEDWFIRDTLIAIKENKLDTLTGYDLIIGKYINKIYIEPVDISLINSITVTNIIEDYCKIPMIIHILNENIKVLLSNEEARLKT